MNEAVVELTYAALDLSPKGELSSAILDHLEDESTHRRLTLTDQTGQLPANITEGMAIWYQDFIAGSRRAALDTVDRVLASVNAVQDALGIFLERRLDQIADDRLARKRLVLSRHFEKNSAERSRINELRATYQRSKRAYDDLFARYGRAPKVIRWWYFAFLLLVGATDVAVNYDAILSTPAWDRPVLAAGTAIGIALVLAFSAHLHGTVLRQWATLFGAHQEDHDRWVAWKMLGLGTLGLSIALGAVWYFRAQFLQAVIVEQSVIGGEAPSWLGTVGGSLTTNIAVWIIGVILAFLLHDPDPHFPEALKTKENDERTLRRAEENFQKPVRREFERIDALSDRAIEQARTQDHSLSHLEEYKLGRELFDRVATQDARVIAVLESYRGRLLSKLRQQKGVVIERTPELPVQAEETLSVEQYGAVPLKIKYI